MRQLGDPPEIDLAMTRIVHDVFLSRGISTTDANDSTGGKDFLERILSLIRSTGFTVAIFSHETRPSAMANIALELGFAAMCGKPIVIVKSDQAVAPSDLKRTDWISCDPNNVSAFKSKLGVAIDEIEKLIKWEEDLLRVALDAQSPDCNVAFERANKGFLLSGEEHFIESAETILDQLDGVDTGSEIADLERLRSEIRMFIRQAKRALR